MSDHQPSGAARQRPHESARIERVFDHCADTRSLFLRIAGDRPLRFLPGMFISITIPLKQGARVRPYTIASSPEDGAKDGEPFEICFNRVADGVGVAWLFDRWVGDTLDFTGPFGTFTLDRPPSSEQVFICEGTAVAPVRPMVHRALAHRPARPLYLIYGADRPEHILYRAELERLAAFHPEFHFEPPIIEPSRDALHAKLRSEAQRRWVSADNERNRHFYICGIGREVLKLRDLLRASGYERRT
ncbi:MAG: ferredoxin--NADP reductase, partial [Candidatus Binataceae bacterium]